MFSTMADCKTMLPESEWYFAAHRNVLSTKMHLLTVYIVIHTYGWCTWYFKQAIMGRSSEPSITYAI